MNLGLKLSIGVLIAVIGFVGYQIYQNSNQTRCIHQHQGPFVQLNYCGPRVVCQSKADSGGTLEVCEFDRTGLDQ